MEGEIFGKQANECETLEKTISFEEIVKLAQNIYSVNKQTNMKLSSSIGFAFTVELRNVSEVKMCRRLFYDGAIR